MRKPLGARARLSPRFPMPPPSASSAAADPSAGSATPRRCLSTFLFLAAVTFPCVALYRAAAPTFPFPTLPPRWSPGPPIANFLTDDADADDAQSESEDVRLEKVLKEAAMEHKTVILTTLNAAWASPGSIIDLFIESFRTGDGTRKLLDHLVIIALDQKACERCMLVHGHCFALITEGVDFSDEKLFMSAGYLSMMWRRIEFLRVVLEKGYNFIFSDVDVLWFRNPLPQFSPEEDFQIACDHFLGNAFDLQNIPNGGFNYVKSNNRTIEFYKFWHTSREKYPGYHDQDVLNFIKRDPFLTEIGIRIRFLSTAFFGGLCEPSRDFSKDVYVSSMEGKKIWSILMESTTELQPCSTCFLKVGGYISLKGIGVFACSLCINFVKFQEIGFVQVISKKLLNLVLIHYKLRLSISF